MAPVAVASDFATVDLAVDLNKDGKPDLIIDNFAPDPDITCDCPHTFTVWTNQGAGRFKATSTLPMTANVNQLSLQVHGDFNGDGYPDVVLFTDKGSQVFLNNKGTGFTAGATLSGLVLAVGGLNHDGKLDLAGLRFSGNNVGQIFLGNGDGTFRTGTTFNASGVTVSSIDIADVNGDGLADIAVVIRDSSGSLELEVFAGTGTGTVNSSTSVFNIGGQQAKLADLNNDGKLDVLLFEPNGLRSGAYFDAGNDGKGNFRAPRENLVPAPDSIVTADFNRDGNGDIAVVSDAATSTGKAGVVVLLGTGKGYFGPAARYPIGMSSGTIVAGDVNGDGKIDLVVAQDTPGGSSTNVSVLLGNGNGTFQPARNFILSGASMTSFLGIKGVTLLLADVNRDGKLDLIGRWGVALGKGDGTFNSPIPLPGSSENIVAIATADFNRDGKVDLVVATERFDSSHGPGVYVLLGDGKGSFTLKGQEQLGNTTLVTDVVVADMNGDGKADLVFDSTQSSTSNPSGVHNLTVRLGNGDGRFQAPINYGLALSRSFNPLIVADFNRDGKPEVFLFEADAPAGKLPGGNLTLLPGIGGGKFSATPQYYSPTLERGVVLDVNRDGALDVVGLSQLGVDRLLNTGSRVAVTK